MKLIVRGNINGWQVFLDGLASEGGNILILFFLVIVTATFVFLNFDGAEGQLYFVLGALVGILKGKITQKENITPDQNNTLLPKGEEIQ